MNITVGVNIADDTYNRKSVILERRKLFTWFIHQISKFQMKQQIRK